MTINFLALPYLVQKRFVEVVAPEGGRIFFRVNENTAAFSNLRKIVQFIRITYNWGDPIPEIYPNVENIKLVEVTNKIHVEGFIDYEIKDDDFSKFIPLYFTKAFIFADYIHFGLLKALIKHKFLKFLHFDCYIDMPPDVKEKEIRDFFDSLVNIQEVKFKSQCIIEEREPFESIAKNSMKGYNHSFGYHEKNKTIVEIEFSK